MRLVASSDPEAVPNFEALQLINERLVLAITMPSDRHRLSQTELAYRKKQSSDHRAANWNELLADNPTYGPRSGYLVGVADEPVNGEWPLIWVRKVYS